MKKIYSFIFLITILILPTLSFTSCVDDMDETVVITDQVPTNFEELWGKYDPRKEPLDIEILREWKEDGVIMKVLRYRVGVFKGQKAMMAAVYGYPEGAKNLPGLLQIHGGGQYAHYDAVKTNAKRGYATLSIAWAGRLNAPEYVVSHDVVKLYWEGKKDDPKYLVTTDWGKVDGYHDPCRDPKNNFVGIVPGEWTLDTKESPYNSGWFLCAMGARRGLTFLEKQPEVDPDRLGVYGHSMGGKLTVLTATDPRVKVAVPSCGGVSDLRNESQLFLNTLSDSVYLKRIKCPILFLNPSNDFHASLEELPAAVHALQTNCWRITTSAHQSHQDNGAFEVSGLLWFDQHLMNSFKYPQQPTANLKLNTNRGIPLFTFKADESREIKEVEVYFSQVANTKDTILTREQRINRYWRYVKPEYKNGQWEAYLPIQTTDAPLLAYANITYKMDKEVEGAGYYYRVYKTKEFNVSTLVQTATSEELKNNNVKCDFITSSIIEDFKGDWRKDWFSYNLSQWDISTHKIFDPEWKAPQNAKLSIKLTAESANKLFVDINKSYKAEIQLAGNNKTEEIVLSPSDFKNEEGEILSSWEVVQCLSFVSSYKDVKWTGKAPLFDLITWK